MKELDKVFKQYLRTCRDIYELLKMTPHNERREFFARICNRFPFISYNRKDYEINLENSFEKGVFPFPFLFIPTNRDELDLDIMEIRSTWPFEIYLENLEHEFGAGEESKQEFTPGEKQISQDVKNLTMQFEKLSENSAKLEQEVFKISYNKDLPKNVVGRITEDGIFKFVEPKTNKEWKIANLDNKELTIKTRISELLNSSKGSKKNLIQEIKNLIDEQDTFQI